MKAIEYNQLECFKTLINDKRIYNSFNDEYFFKELINYNRVDMLIYILDHYDINPFSNSNYRFVSSSLELKKFDISTIFINNKYYDNNNIDVFLSVTENSLSNLKLLLNHKYFSIDLLIKNDIVFLFNEPLIHNNKDILETLYHHSELIDVLKKEDFSYYNMIKKTILSYKIKDF
jgi:hypothetical protein